MVPVDGSAAPQQVTRDRFDYGAPTWSPDGTRLAAPAARQPDFDLEPHNDIWVIDVAQALAADPADTDAFEPRQLTATDASYRQLAWEPDGERIACLRNVEQIGYRHTRVAVVDSDDRRGHGAHREARPQLRARSRASARRSGTATG